MMKKLIATLLTACFCLTAFASVDQANTLPNSNIKPMVQVDIRLGSGDQAERHRLKIELDASQAPETVKNFLSYVDEKFYDNTIFHRLIPGFMIQGGGFTQDLSQKVTHDPVKNEASATLKNKHGTIAMARTMDVNSATSQFYINFVDNAFLDHQDETDQGYGYAVFGRVVEGLDWLDQLQSQETKQQNGYTDVPAKPIVIERLIRVPAS